VRVHWRARRVHTAPGRPAAGCGTNIQDFIRFA
jgi:hypothetical protein